MTPGTKSPIRRTLGVMTLFLTACAGEPGTDDEAEQPAPSAPLREGRYEASGETFDEGCGGRFVGGTYLPVTLAWTTETDFELRYDEGTDVTDIACTLDGTEAATCGGFHQEIERPEEGYVEVLDSVTRSLTITSAKSFDLAATWTLSCEGEGCAAVEGFTWPCSVETSGTFAK